MAKWGVEEKGGVILQANCLSMQSQKISSPIVLMVLVNHEDHQFGTSKFSFALE